MPSTQGIESGGELHELHIPPSGTPKQIDIVAVHGLNGDSHNTWTHIPEGGKGPQTLWLRDLLPGKLPNAHVMSFQYDSSTHGMSEQSVRGNAGKLVRLLRDKREDYEEEERPIVFIGHSLGGIVIKQALKHAKDHDFTDIYAHTNGIVFFGTPHRGADAASWAATLSGILSAASRKPPSKFLEALKNDSVELRKISEDFRPFGGRFNIVSFYEEHAHRLLGRVVVDKSSAIMGLPNEDPMMLGGNHSTMCKFGVGDRRFDPVWRAIRRAAKARQA
ncbi:Alpha/Beta hydrolase protein [Chaetomium fimeti]|uniref:Alpha/Beta hydrolase protein n=1 Tax=Chaetomium fimeti TaxID=1854472 RepID=A0AAE0LSA1_9PEZI|nr:Alpha/Beta hydrolase protein [Chaetomium fimeti]